MPVETFLDRHENQHETFEGLSSNLGRFVLGILSLAVSLACVTCEAQFIQSFPLEDETVETQTMETRPSPESSDEEESDELPTIADRTSKLNKQTGFFSFWFDDKTGQILLEVPEFGKEFLHVHALATGLGSNPVGLDRGQLGGEKVVRFERIGRKVLLTQRNLRFRANSDNAAERNAVEQSFAQSVLWGGTVEAESENGAALIDVTSLLLSDIHGVVQTLARTEQGDFKLDESRSAVYLPRCKAFPKNTELESTLTFASSKPGNLVRQTTPSPNSVTLRQHHSFIELPDDQYRPRVYDVRSPCIHITFADYASPIDQPLDQRWITRHRLEKQDPAAAISPAVEPIVYYVDPGAPKQIQEALVEGASWWNEAFESAGFQDAFQVKLLPVDADPLDVRYNVIQWVHRSTRGWSYGGSVIDPRTGEIIKGHVTLGSLRVRQDNLLALGLVDQVPTGNPNLRCECCGVGSLPSETPLAALARKADPVEVALARIRQLSAHEVGHTLGFVHNFAASTYGDRASVMDYPAPRIKITPDNELDLSDAYGVGIGSWDKVAVQFAYTQFGAETQNEKQELDRILTNAANRGMVFISDADARPEGAAHPRANLWDNGKNIVEELNHLLRVRRIALDQFSLRRLPTGTPTADAEQYLVPIYLHHRYQLKAVGKLIGGVLYDYGTSEVGNSLVAVPFAEQLLAIRAILRSIEPEQLEMRPQIIRSIGVKPYGQLRDQEAFPRNTGRTFDPFAAAKVACDLAIKELFQHERLTRLSQQCAEIQNMDLQKYVIVVCDVIWTYNKNAKTSNEQRLARIARKSLINQLMKLADHTAASNDVKSAALHGLYHLETTSNKDLETEEDQAEIAFLNLIRREMAQIIERPYAQAPVLQPTKTPPGSPIGSPIGSPRQN